MHTPPTHIGSTEVYVCGDPLAVNGEDWVTLSPEDDSDERLWEFSLTPGWGIVNSRPTGPATKEPR